MKLYEFKALFMARLSLLEPKDEHEKTLINNLITKLNYMRMMDLPNIVHTLHLIIRHENISEEFKKLCMEMLKNISRLDFGND